MAQPNLALRTTRNGLFSHYVVAGSRNPPPLDVGSVKRNGTTQSSTKERVWVWMPLPNPDNNSSVTA